MLAFRSILIAAVALSSSVLAAFEPLDAGDLFARNPQYEPLGYAPSVTRRQVAGHHLPRAHSVVARGGAASPFAPELISALRDAHSQLTPVAHTVSSFVGAHKGKARKQKPEAVIATLQPQLNRCRQTVHDCGHHVHQIPHHPRPHPSGGYGGHPPGPGDCSSLLKELIELIEELIAEIKALAKEIPALAHILEGYIEDLDAELADLVSGAETAVSGVTSNLQHLTGSLQPALRNIGFHGLLDTIGGRH